MKKWIVSEEKINAKDGRFVVVREGEERVLNGSKVTSDVLFYTTDSGYDYNHPRSKALALAVGIAKGLNDAEDKLYGRTDGKNGRQVALDYLRQFFPLHEFKWELYGVTDEEDDGRWIPVDDGRRRDRITGLYILPDDRGGSVGQQFDLVGPGFAINTYFLQGVETVKDLRKRIEGLSSVTVRAIDNDYWNEKK